MTKPNQPVVHRYDDIEEEDNRLPNWWLFIFFATIVFSFFYWLVFHTTGALPNPTQQYATEAAELKKQRLAANPVSEEALLALVNDAKAIEDGKAVFTSTCASCHGQQAEGLVGPNLTDKFWIHGNKATDVLKGVNEGYVAMGMPPWGPILGADKTRKVVAYVMSIRNTNVAGKAPQGEPLE